MYWDAVISRFYLHCSRSDDMDTYVSDLEARERAAGEQKEDTDVAAKRLQQEVRDFLNHCLCNL